MNRKWTERAIAAVLIVLMIAAYLFLPAGAMFLPGEAACGPAGCPRATATPCGASCPKATKIPTSTPPVPWVRDADPVITPDDTATEQAAAMTAEAPDNDEPKVTPTPIAHLPKATATPVASLPKATSTPAASGSR